MCKYPYYEIEASAPSAKANESQIFTFISKLMVTILSTSFHSLEIQF